MGGATLGGDERTGHMGDLQELSQGSSLSVGVVHLEKDTTFIHLLKKGIGRKYERD